MTGGALTCGVLIIIAVASVYSVLPDRCVHVKLWFGLVHSLLVLVSVLFFSIQLYCSQSEIVS